MQVRGNEHGHRGRRAGCLLQTGRLQRHGQNKDEDGQSSRKNRSISGQMKERRLQLFRRYADLRSIFTSATTSFSFFFSGTKDTLSPFSAAGFMLE